MKVLSFSSVCFVGVLMLGLFVTWSASAPQQISGNREVAGCPDRCEWHVMNCAGGEKCKGTYFGCRPGGEGECEKLRCDTCYVCTSIYCTTIRDEVCIE